MHKQCLLGCEVSNFGEEANVYFDEVYSKRNVRITRLKRFNPELA